MTSIEILKIEGGTPWHANPYAKAAKKDELLGETHAVFGQTHAAVRLAPFSGGQKQARAPSKPGTMVFCVPNAVAAQGSICTLFAQRAEGHGVGGRGVNAHFLPLGIGQELRGRQTPA